MICAEKICATGFKPYIQQKAPFGRETKGARLIIMKKR